MYKENPRLILPWAFFFLLHNLLIRHPRVAVLQVDDAAGDKAMLLQHAAHDGISLVGVDAQGALAQDAGEALGVLDDGGGDAAAPMGHRDGHAVEGDVTAVSRLVAVGGLPGAVFNDGVGGLAAVDDGEGTDHLVVLQDNAALSLGHVLGDHGAVGGAVLPLVDPKGGDAAAGLLNDPHDCGNICGNGNTNIHGITSVSGTPAGPWPISPHSAVGAR